MIFPKFSGSVEKSIVYFQLINHFIAIILSYFGGKINLVRTVTLIYLIMCVCVLMMDVDYCDVRKINSKK